MANARRITCNTGWQATVDRTLLIGHLPPLDDWREADEESTAISNNSTSKAAWTGNRQARTTMLVPLLGWRQCQTIRAPQEDPCRPANRRRPPTAPPIRPGIAVGVVAVGNPARVALRHLYRAQRAARPIRIAPIACRPLPRAHCAYRTLPASPSALRPSHAARTHPSCCGYHGALAGKNRAACIPFSPSARKRPPPWQHLREMHASRDQDGKILALCVHFQAQSGDSGRMACESCHQGPLFASRAQKSYMARRCCQRCPAFRGASPRAAGPRTGRTGLAPCGLGLARLPHMRVSAVPSAPLHRPHRANRPGLHHASRALGAHRSHPHRPSQSGGATRARCPRCPPSASCAVTNERNRAANSMRA